jgi:putative membrane protein
MSINKQIISFFVRWVANSFGLWAAVSAGLLIMQGDFKQYAIGGLMLAVLNAVIKPMLLVFSLPIVVFSLGLFTFVINAAILYLLAWIYGPLQITGFISALLAGIIISLINYIITILFERLIK